jgi:CHAD domain-containing protein
MCVLVVLKPCFPRNESGRIRRRLKRIMLLAGSVRDRDIALRLLKESAPSASSPLVHQFRTEREEAARTLVGLLKRWVRRNSSAKWRNALEGESAAEVSRANPVEITAKQVLPRMAREYFERGKDASRDESPVEMLHRLRIAAKNLRYTLDLFAPLYGASIAGLLQQLKGVQALLGEINDCATVRRMVSHHEGGQQILPALKRTQREKAETVPAALGRGIFQRRLDPAVDRQPPSRERPGPGNEETAGS